MFYFTTNHTNLTNMELALPICWAALLENLFVQFVRFVVKTKGHQRIYIDYHRFYYDLFFHH